MKRLALPFIALTLSMGVSDTATINVIPEPSSLALLGIGGLALLRRRR